VDGDQRTGIFHRSIILIVIEGTDENIQSRNLADAKRPVSWIGFALVAFFLFFFALHLLQASFAHAGNDTISTIIKATANPFTGFFIGLLLTAIIQSSSTTTAFVVALVGSQSLSLEDGVPIIMGANVGTTITSLIVSLAFISKGKEFKRAVSCASYHCFFNLLTLLILFPLEYYYGFLSSFSSMIAKSFYGEDAITTQSPSVNVMDPLTNRIFNYLPNMWLVVALAFLMLFGSILLFRRTISNVLNAHSPNAFSKFFFKGKAKALGWGIITTAAIRSSTITTSIVVPMVAKKIARLRQAAPYIMGANLGTTITAFLALLFNVNSTTALSIAIAHFLFNLVGVLLFLPIPVLQNLPIELSLGMGKLCERYRVTIFVFVLAVFFLIPFSLIYITSY
jgi:solute carrier family 34 (sodium-dependent phosphate cotransporter)